jgi:molybdenum cofactor cytidylyltransferase
METIENETLTAAVVLAAGESKRMGRPKLVLPWGQGSVIGHVVLTLMEAGVKEIVVVTGGANLQVITALSALPVRTLHNPDYAGGEMLSSCQLGLTALDSRISAALIVLGDQPQIEVGVVKSVVGVFEKDHPLLVVPSYQMHRGHPWLAARSLWPAIKALRPPQTLRDFFAQNAAQITYVPVETDSILQDLDTPADYERFTRL